MQQQPSSDAEDIRAALLALRARMIAIRTMPDGSVHTPSSDAELVLEATGECLAALVERVVRLEAGASGLMAVSDTAHEHRAAAE